MLKNYLNDPTQQQRLFNNRVLVTIIGMIILALILLGRLYYLQVNRYQYYSVLSKNNAINLIPIAPRRGLIFDRHGHLLAKNETVYNLVLIPSEVKNLQQTLKQLEKIIPINQDELTAFYRQYHQRRRFEQVPLKLKLSQKQAAIFAVNSWRFSGISVQAQLMRNYPYGSAFAHVLGYVSRINSRDLKQVDIDNYAGTNFIGKTGIEKYYEPLLHGKVGYQQVEMDANGRPVRTLSTTPAQAGANLYLTLDKGLQIAAEKALGDKVGAAVVIQVNTGAILAMVSTPSFDPNVFVRGISNKHYQALLRNPQKPLYDRNIRGLYASGSTIKPFIAIGALDDGVITPQYHINDRGYFTLPHNKHIYHDWLRGGHGTVNVSKAIIVSCDTFFYNLGYKMGIDKIDQILNKFGLGQKTGIDLPNELSGVLPSPAWKKRAYGIPWYLGDTVITSIGQGYLLVTPMILASMTATLATRGHRYKPYLLNATQSAGKIKYVTPQALPSVILKHPQTWNTVLQAMHKVISQYGTAWSFGIPKTYTAAAKTGTAQVTSQNFSEDYTNVPKALWPDSWIIVFAPYKDPQIAITVLVEHGPGKSAPIARKIADYYFTHQAKIIATTTDNSDKIIDN